MSDERTQRLVREGLLKGCLGGIALTILFIVISGVTYLLLFRSGLQQNLVLFASILSGPVIGTTVVLAWLYARAHRLSTTPARELPADTPSVNEHD